MFATFQTYIAIACCCAGMTVPSFAAAHDDTLHCDAVTASITSAGFDDTVTVTCTDTTAISRSDTYPDHPLMTGITGTNEQVPVPARDYASPIPLQPQKGLLPLTRDAALGVAVNGVPIYDYSAGGEMSLYDLSHHQPHNDTVLTGQLDTCGGHAGRGDDYHYHKAPTCMIAQMPNAGAGAIIGWAFDGYPIYGDANPDGTPIAEGTLDMCNGQADDTFGHRYHTSPNAPYIVQCLVGAVPDAANLPRVSPLDRQGWRGNPAAGFPPEGGVDDLMFSEDASGTRRMTYSYHGSDYYISYSPTDTPHCYAFETKTVTNGGKAFTAIMCRK